MPFLGAAEPSELGFDPEVQISKAIVGAVLLWPTNTHPLQILSPLPPRAKLTNTNSNGTVLTQIEKAILIL